MTSEAEKPPRRMTCWNCPRYSRSDLRCRDGKANPRRKSDSVAVAETLGVRSLCHYNPYRVPLSMRTFFPSDPATIRASARARRRRPRSLCELDGDVKSESSSPDGSVTGAPE